MYDSQQVCCIWIVTFCWFSLRREVVIVIVVVIATRYCERSTAIIERCAIKRIVAATHRRLLLLDMNKRNVYVGVGRRKEINGKEKNKKAIHHLIVDYYVPVFASSAEALVLVAVVNLSLPEWG